MHTWPPVVPTMWAPSDLSSPTTIDALADLLISQGHTLLSLDSAQSMDLHLRDHIERLNERQLSDAEWQRLYSTVINPANPLSHGDTIDQALTRYYSTDSHSFTGDDGEQHTVILADRRQLHRNVLEVLPHHDTQRLTIFLNGFPLLHLAILPADKPLEEEVRTLTPESLAEDLWVSPLARFLTVRVATNGTDTRYYSATTWPFSLSCRRVADTHEADISPVAHLTHWTDTQYVRISAMGDFARTFLRPDALVRILTWYCLATPYGSTLVMRPHQIATAEEVIRRTLPEAEASEMDSLGTAGPAHSRKESDRYLNGYAWHAPGSGRTTTVHLIASILKRLPHIDHTIIVLHDEHASIPNRALLMPHSSSPYSVFSIAELVPLVSHDAEEDHPLRWRSSLVNVSALEILSGLRGHTDSLLHNVMCRLRAGTSARRVVVLEDNCVQPLTIDKTPALSLLFPNSIHFRVANQIHLSPQDACHSLLPHEATAAGYVLPVLYQEVSKSDLPPMPCVPRIREELLRLVTRGRLGSAEVVQAKGRVPRNAYYIYRALMEYCTHNPTSFSSDSPRVFERSAPPVAVLFVDSFAAAVNYGAYLSGIASGTPLRINMVLDRCLGDGNRLFKGPPQRSIDYPYASDLFPDWEHYDEVNRHQVEFGEIDLVIAVKRWTAGTHSARLSMVFIDTPLDEQDLCDVLSLSTRTTADIRQHGLVTSFVHQRAIRKLKNTLWAEHLSDLTGQRPLATSEQTPEEPCERDTATPERTLICFGRRPDGVLERLSPEDSAIVDAAPTASTRSETPITVQKVYARYNDIFTLTFHGKYEGRTLHFTHEGTAPCHANGAPLGLVTYGEFSRGTPGPHQIFGFNSGHYERGLEHWSGCVIPFTSLSETEISVERVYTADTTKETDKPWRTYSIPVLDLMLAATEGRYPSSWFDEL